MRQFMTLSVLLTALVGSNAFAGTVQATSPAEVAKLLKSTPELAAEVNATMMAWGPAQVTNVTVSTACRRWTTRETDPYSENTMAVTHTACARTGAATIDYISDRVDADAPTKVTSSAKY